MKRNLVITVITALLIIVFTYAAVSKLLDYSNFRLQLSKSPFITQFAPIVAWALPAIEIIIALALTDKRTKLAGLYASLFLMTMFTAYIYAMLHFSYYVPCSCGGILSKMSWQAHLWFNGVLILVTITGILLESKMVNIERQDKKKMQDQDIAKTMLAPVASC